MTFDQKIELLKLTDCTVADIHQILQIIRANDSKMDNTLEGKELLQSLSENLLHCYNLEKDQDKKLYAFFYYSKIETYSKFLNEDEGKEEDEEDDETEDEFNLGYKKDQEKQKMFVDKVRDKGTKDISFEIVGFLKSADPNLLYNGFDRKVISNLIENYKEINHIKRLHFLPDKIYSKTYKAINNSKDLIKKEIIAFQKLNIRQYAEDYKKWLSENEINKKTRQNFKYFIKEMKINIDAILIDKIIDFNID
jgi:hypothetical protein